MKLYHHALNPDSRRVRVVLNEKNLDFDLQEVKYWERDESFLELNPAGNVPVLVDNGKTICGANIICEYLEEAYDARNLIGRSPLQKAETRRLVEWFSDKFYREVTRNLVWEKYYRKLEGLGYPNSKAMAAGRENILYHLDYIDYLTKGRRWMMGEEISLADITAATQLSVLDYYGDVPWEYNKRAKDWYSLIKSRPSYRTVLNDKVGGLLPVRHYQNLEF